MGRAYFPACTGLLVKLNCFYETLLESSTQVLDFSIAPATPGILEPMSLAVRRVSLITDREEILALLNRHFGTGQEPRFEWRHAANPAGESWTWFLYERDTKVTVAMASVFPRPMYVDGKPLVWGQVGEFAVGATHRSLGPAVLLQRTTLEPVNAGALAVCYDCPPHDQGMSTFVRMGMKANCEVIRYALLFRSDEYLARKLGRGAWTKPVAGAANLLLTMRRRRSKRGFSGLEIQTFDGRFDEEFSKLDELVPSCGAVRSSRSAAFLNWCYRDNPGSNTRVLVARRAGELVGFLAFSVENGSALILDIFGIEPSVVATELLNAAIEMTRREKGSGLYGFCAADSDLKKLLESFGFRPRERTARVVAYEKPGVVTRPLLAPGLRWDFGQPEVSL